MTFDLYLINLNSCRGNYSRAETIRGNTVSLIVIKMKGKNFQKTHRGNGNEDTLMHYYQDYITLKLVIAIVARSTLGDSMILISNYKID